MCQTEAIFKMDEYIWDSPHGGFKYSDVKKEGRNEENSFSNTDDSLLSGQLFIDEVSLNITTDNRENLDVTPLEHKTNATSLHGKNISDSQYLFKAENIDEGVSTDNLVNCLSEETIVHEPGESDDSTFNCLPDELIVNIFSYLNAQDICRSASPVCRKWRTLAKDHSLWHVLDFSHFPSLTSLDLLLVVRRAPLLRKLSLRGRMNITPVEIAIISESCPRIQELDLGFCNDVTETILQIVVENCSFLQKINVEGGVNIGKRCLQVLSQSSSLTSLNFSHCVTIQNSDVKHLAEQLKIIAINLDGNNFITDSGVINLVMLQSAHLQELELDGAEISDASLQEISQCSDLRHLGISFCECLTDQSLEYLKNCHRLEHLRLRKGCDFTKAGLSTFFRSANLSHLHTLNLSECTAINSDVVLDIVQSCGSGLCDLALSWCWNISDRGLVSIMDHCSALTTLDLLGIDNVHGECLERIPDDMPKLTYLDLRQCNKIVDSIIVDVVRRKPDLKVINYYGEEFVHS